MNYSSGHLIDPPSSSNTPPPRSRPTWRSCPITRLIHLSSSINSRRPLPSLFIPRSGVPVSSLSFSAVIGSLIQSFIVCPLGRRRSYRFCVLTEVPLGPNLRRSVTEIISKLIAQSKICFMRWTALACHTIRNWRIGIRILDVGIRTQMESVIAEFYKHHSWRRWKG